MVPHFHSALWKFRVVTAEPRTQGKTGRWSVFPRSEMSVLDVRGMILVSTNGVA